MATSSNAQFLTPFKYQTKPHDSYLYPTRILQDIMEEKIRTEEIKRYSREFSAVIANSFFSTKTKINGQEILKLCSVRQVNLFIIFELMKTWTTEIEKLKSPYFDYSAQPVKDALTQFQNTLSNHISISPQHFLPLLERAVYKTLCLAISPYDFYSTILDNEGNEYLSVSDLKREIKYLKINGAPLERMLQKLTEEKKLDIVSGKELFGLLDGLLEEVNFSPEDPEIYLSEFSKSLPVTLSDFYEKVIPTPTPARKVVTPAPTKKPLPVVQTTLYEQLIPSEAKPTLADNFQKRKIAKLRDSLSINQKFMFTKMLFNGDFEIFTQAIERIDMLDNLKQAMNYIQNDYPEWDRDSEEYQEFWGMVEKRFLEVEG
jgi:hypothetical protein